MNLSNEEEDNPDVTEHLQRSPIKRSVTSMSLVRPDKRSNTSMSVNLPFRRNVTGISVNNIPNVRSSTSLSMASQSRRKSGTMIVFGKDQQSTKRPIPAATWINGGKLLTKRNESQVPLETPDLNSTMNVKSLHNGELEGSLNDTRNTFSGYNGKLTTGQFTPRPKTSLGHSNVKVVIKAKQGQGQNEDQGQGLSARSRTLHRKNTLSGLFGDEQEKPTLLELHKERVKSANYMTKIVTFTNDLQEWKADERDIIQDYYYTGQVETNRLNSAGTAAAGGRERMNSMKSSLIKRYTGDLQVKNLTFPKLEL